MKDGVEMGLEGSLRVGWKSNALPCLLHRPEKKAAAANPGILVLVLLASCTGWHLGTLFQC